MKFASTVSQPEADQVGDRIQRQGYTYSTTAENVSSYSSSIWDSHAAFIVDWGTSASTGLTYGGSRIQLVTETMYMGVVFEKSEWV